MRKLLMAGAITSALSGVCYAEANFSAPPSSDIPRAATKKVCSNPPPIPILTTKQRLEMKPLFQTIGDVVYAAQVGEAPNETVVLVSAFCIDQAPNEEKMFLLVAGYMKRLHPAAMRRRFLASFRIAPSVEEYIMNDFQNPEGD
jgi:hypothetical protein